MTDGPSPRFQPSGDSAVLVTLGQGIDLAINQRVHALAARLSAHSLPGLGEAVPGYCTLLVHYDPAQLSYAQAHQAVAQALAELEARPPAPARLVEIPVRYGGQDGPDLEYVAARGGLCAEEVVRLHAGREYRVYLMGFTPGFPYLGELDARLETPRLETPRLRVPAGSVGIAGRQTGIYPIDSPGGWRLIGRTPLSVFDAAREPHFRLAPGDRVRFLPLD